MNTQEIDLQEKTSRMTRIHVLANVTPILSYIQHRAFEGDDEAPWSEGDIENFRAANVDTLDKEELQEILDDAGVSWDEAAESDDPENEGEQEAVRNYIRDNHLGDPTEIYEWYLISDWLAAQLRGHKQALVSDGLNWYWGRGGSGQAVYMDDYMQEIASGWIG